jgi:hypothetical protein
MSNTISSQKKIPPIFIINVGYGVEIGVCFLTF